jgi:hypothetical protein
MEGYPVLSGFRGRVLKRNASVVDLREKIGDSSYTPAVAHFWVLTGFALLVARCGTTPVSLVSVLKLCIK